MSISVILLFFSFASAVLINSCELPDGIIAIIICRMAVGIVDNMCIIIVISFVILDIRIDTPILFYLTFFWIITYIYILIGLYLGSVAIDISILSLLLLLIFTMVTTMLTDISLIICNMAVFVCWALMIAVVLFCVFVVI